MQESVLFASEGEDVRGAIGALIILLGTLSSCFTMIGISRRCAGSTWVMSCIRLSLLLVIVVQAVVAIDLFSEQMLQYDASSFEVKTFCIVAVCLTALYSLFCPTRTLLR